MKVRGRKSKMGNHMPTPIHLPYLFNMDHFRKFAYLYTELIYQSNIEQYANEFVYTNGGNKDKDVQMLSLDNNTKCYIRTADLKTVYDIWLRLCECSFDGFTKWEMRQLNKINRELQEYKQAHQPYRQMDDPFGTWSFSIMGVKIIQPTTHHIIYTA